MHAQQVHELLPFSQEHCPARFWGYCRVHRRRSDWIWLWVDTRSDRVNAV